MTPLPPGFQLDPYLDGSALRVDGVMVAVYTALDNGSWRVTVGVGFASMRHEFLSSEDAAVRYVTAWARKWQSAIRESASRPLVRGWNATVSHSPTRIDGEPLSASNAP